MNLSEHITELNAEEHSSLSRVILKLRSMDTPVFSDGFNERVLAALPQKKPLWKYLWRIAAAASVAILATFSWLSEKPSPALAAQHSFRPAIAALDLLSSPKDLTLRKTIEASQTPDGGFGGEGLCAAYNTALATCALATAGSDKEVLQKAVSALARTQTPSGAWDCGQTRNGDAALTSWCLRALAAADEAGVTEAKRPLKMGLRWVRTNGFAQGRSPEQIALSAHALLAAEKSYKELGGEGRKILASISAGSARAEEIALKAAGGEAFSRSFFAKTRN